MRTGIRFVLCLLVFVTAGCTAPGPLPSESPLGQPSPLPFDSPLAPSPPSDTVPITPLQFQIDRPVRAGDTTISGSGPGGIPIVIVNVTTMGEELGSGVIGPDNRFVITVQPLTASVRIGVALGDLTGTGRTYEEFNSDEYKGQDALLVPLVGYFLDTALVQP